MDELFFEKTKIMARQIILGFVDINLFAFSNFDSRKIYRTPLKKYEDFRIEDKEKFKKELYRLQQKKFIKKYFVNKDEYLELTNKGKQILRKDIIDQLSFKIPMRWDKKWRIVVFDIPVENSKRRDILRHKLQRIGFIELQKSVYVFPFDCWPEINFLKNVYYISSHVQYIVADRIETEKDLIKEFLDRRILKNSMLE